MNKNTDNALIDILKGILDEVKSIKEVKQEKVTLTIREAALYCGIGHEKIRDLVEKNNTDFPFFKVGCRVAINKEMLDDWLVKISKEHRQV